MAAEFFDEYPADRQITTEISFGAFDSTLDFGNNTLTVIVRLAWNFGHSFKRNKFGGRRLWGPNDQDHFKTSHRNIVMDYWPDRYPIVIRHKSGETRHISVDFEIQDVTGGGAKEHCQMWVSALPAGQSYVAGGGGRCKLHAYDADDDPTHSVVRNIHAWAIKKAPVKEMNKAIAELATGGVKFNEGHSDLDADAIEQLDKFAASLQVDLPVFPCLTLKIKSYRLPNESPALDSNRYEEVKAYLTGKGFPAYCFDSKPGGTVSGPSVVARIRGVGQQARPYVTLQFRKSSARAFVDQTFIYPIAAHEFGHQLGLPDEYHFSEKGLRQHANAQQAYLELCTKYGVAPVPLNTNSMSLMACGNLVKPCHYVTLAGAVHQHLYNFYTSEMIVDRLNQADPSMSRQDIRDTARRIVISRYQEDYKITIAGAGRERRTDRVALGRYAPLEDAPDSPFEDL